MNTQQRKALGVWLLLCAAWMAWSSYGGGLSIPGIVAPKVTAVTYVYEKDDHAVPNAVLAVLNELNRKSIVANSIDQDIVDGSGGTPDPYKVPIAAAKEAGLPALVATAGEKVVKTVKNPTTEEAAREVVQ